MTPPVRLTPRETAREITKGRGLASLFGFNSGQLAPPAVFDPRHGRTAHASCPRDLRLRCFRVYAPRLDYSGPPLSRKPFISFGRSPGRQVDALPFREPPDL